MKLNGKRLAIATIIELAVRTTSKVSIANTNRGLGRITPEMYAESTLKVKNELVARGMINV